jgi:hypothetical protein
MSDGNSWQSKQGLKMKKERATSIKGEQVTALPFLFIQIA